MPAGSAFWAVPPLTTPELDAGNCGGRRQARWSSAQKEEKGPQACDPRVDHSRADPI